MIPVYLYTKRDPGLTKYHKVLHYLNVQRKCLGLSRAARVGLVASDRVRIADRDVTTN